MQIRRLGFFIFLWLMASCNKQTDQEDPVIEILYPAENELINAASTLDVVARLTDNIKVENVRAGLVNTDLIPLTQPLFFEINQADSLLHLKLKITNDIFEDEQDDLAVCLIQLQASDGFNQKNKYRQIQILRAQNTVNEYVYTTFSGQETFFWSYNSSTSVTRLMDTVSSAVAMLKGQLNESEYFFYSSYPPQLQASKMGQKEPLWVKDISFPVPEIADIYLIEDDLLYADRNGHVVLTHAQTGNTILTASVDSKYRISAVCLDQQYLYVSATDLQLGKTELLLYFRASGVFYKRFFLDQPNIDLQFCKVMQKLVLLDVAEGQTIVSTFDPERERIQLVDRIPSFAFTKAISAGSTLYALYNNQQVLVFDVQTTQHNFIYSGQEIKAVLQRSLAEGDLAILDGNTLYVDGDYLSLNEEVGEMTIVTVPNE